MQARPVEEKPTVEPPAIQEVAEHLMVEKLVWTEEMKGVSEEKMKEVSEEKMKEVSEEEMKEENKVEMVNSRVRHTVWRHWEEERVAEVRGLVDVEEKEKVAEHLRVKLVTHDGTPRKKPPEFRIFWVPPFGRIEWVPPLNTKKHLRVMRRTGKQPWGIFY